MCGNFLVDQWIHSPSKLHNIHSATLTIYNYRLSILHVAFQCLIQPPFSILKTSQIQLFFENKGHWLVSMYFNQDVCVLELEQLVCIYSLDWCFSDFKWAPVLKTLLFTMILAKLKSYSLAKIMVNKILILFLILPLWLQIFTSW